MYNKKSQSFEELPCYGTKSNDKLNVTHRLAKTHAVGSRTGALTLGSGGLYVAFAAVLNPTPLVTFPAPASSNAACGFPALRLPDSFSSRFMGPIVPERLSLAVNTGSCSH